MCLGGSEPLLGGARPIDVLAMHGAHSLSLMCLRCIVYSPIIQSLPLTSPEVPCMFPRRGGCLDNPDLYSVLYLSGAAAGAIAESFGRFPEWSQAILAGSPA